MERHLDTARFFAGEGYTVADIALYAYTHAAADGGFELQRFPAVRAWIERVQSQAHFVPMPPMAGG
jgi:glutathione S-transferase